MAVAIIIFISFYPTPLPPPFLPFIVIIIYPHYHTAPPPRFHHKTSITTTSLSLSLPSPIIIPSLSSRPHYHLRLPVSSPPNMKSPLPSPPTWNPVSLTRYEKDPYLKLGQINFREDIYLSSATSMSQQTKRSLSLSHFSSFKLIAPLGEFCFLLPFSQKTTIKLNWNLTALPTHTAQRKWK